MTLNLGPAATVEKATVAGSDNKVNGTGDLLDCTIPEGSTASVEVMGAFVVGNNTYQPLVTEPYEFPTPEVETIVEVTHTFNDITEPKGYHWNCTTSKDSAGKISLDFDGAYSQAFFGFPGSIDPTKVESITFDGLTGNFELRLLTEEEYNAYSGGPEDSISFTEYNTTVATNGTPVKYVIIVSKDGSDMTCDSITFKMKSSGETVTSKTFDFLNLNKSNPTHNNTTATETADGVKIAFSGKYTQSIFALPSSLNVKDYKALNVTMAGDGAGEILVALVVPDSAWGDKIAIWQGLVPTDAMGAYTLNFNDCFDASYAPSSIEGLDAQTGFIFVQANSQACEATFKTVEFVAK